MRNKLYVQTISTPLHSLMVDLELLSCKVVDKVIEDKEMNEGECHEGPNDRALVWLKQKGKVKAGIIIEEKT